MELKAGSRITSSCDTTEVMVIRQPEGPVDLRCGGHPMIDGAAAVGDGIVPQAGFDQGTQVGKRYVDEATGIELLCVKAGPGSLSLGDAPLSIKESKPLPSSD